MLLRQPENRFFRLPIVFRLPIATKILNKLHKTPAKRLEYALSFSRLRNGIEAA